MFENRRNLDITRPKIKESVMAKLKNGLAGPAFLIQMKSDHREIDKYMAKYKKAKSPRKKVRDFTHSQMSITSKTPFLSAIKPKKERFFNQTSEKVRDIVNFDKEMQENSDLFASTILPASTDAGGTFMANTTSRGPNAFATLSTMRGSISKF